MYNNCKQRMRSDVSFSLISPIPLTIDVYEIYGHFFFLREMFIFVFFQKVSKTLVYEEDV